MSALYVIQLNAQSRYDPSQAFAPLFYPSYGDEVRAADGSPGAKYWQNSADYTIEATLDTVHNTIAGTVSMVYTNNSPQVLDEVWLQLDQNIYKRSSRSVLTTDTSCGRWANNKLFEGGYHITSIMLGNKRLGAADYLITDTRMKIRLPKSLRPHGGKISIKLGYDFSIPQYGTDRLGIAATKNGSIYEIAQWYPRMCVYDNVCGWNTLP